MFTFIARCWTLNIALGLSWTEILTILSFCEKEYKLHILDFNYI